jgi:folylpolyglutamate synthase/dihydropteroate synthase
MQQAWEKVYSSATSSVLPSIQDAVEEVQKNGIEHVLVCGSLHLIGGVMSHLKEAELLDESLNGVY